MDPDIQNLFGKPHSFSFCANDVMMLVGSILLLLILMAEFFDYGNVLFPRVRKPCLTANPDTAPYPSYDYGYEDCNGPSVWKCEYPAALGCRQSPINIMCENALVCPIAPLNWSCEFTVMPDRIRIHNDGHCVMLRARYAGLRPKIFGGPLQANYDLYSIRFRWGATDDEGSEHTIDYRRYAMELQAIHVKSGCHCDDENINNDASLNNDSIIVISYVFQATTIDNPYLEPVLSQLDRIRYPGYSAQVLPFPICWLMPAFISDYYMYQGSLTYPPCTEGVQWIVQPEPLAVSPRQVRKFRKLMTRSSGKMLTNTRPIQNINNRDIFYYTASE